VSERLRDRLVNFDKNPGHGASDLRVCGKSSAFTHAAAISV
jgi:hypothetical protein